MECNLDFLDEGGINNSSIHSDQSPHLAVLFISCPHCLGLKWGIKTLALICLELGMFIISYVWMVDDTWFITDLLVQSFGHYIQYLQQLGFHASALGQSEQGNADGAG